MSCPSLTRFRKHLRAVPALCWMLIALVAWSQPAAAQSRELQRPVVRASEVEDLVRFLKLDEAESDLVRSLFQGYLTVHMAASKEWVSRTRALAESLQAGGDRDAFQVSMAEFLREWREKRQRIAADFFENCKALLTPEQLSAWPIYERDRRRRSNLPAGAFFAGEGVDVAALVDELELDDSLVSAVAPLVEAYCTEIDALLVRRMAASKEARELDLSIQLTDIDGWFAACLRAFDIRRQIRDSNRKHLELMATTVPGDVSDKLRDKFNRASHPHYFAPTQADAYFERLRSLEDLTDDQRRGIESIVSAFQDQVGAINLRLVRLENEIEEVLSRLTNQRHPFVIGLVAGNAALADMPFEDAPESWRAQDVLIDDSQFEKHEGLLSQKRGYVIAAIEQSWNVLTPAQQTLMPIEDIPLESKQRTRTKTIRTGMLENLRAVYER